MRYLLSILLVIPLLLCGQSIPVEFRTRYYYRNPDTSALTARLNPDKKILAFLNKYGLLYVDSCTAFAKRQHGNDSILNVTKQIITEPFFIYATEVSNKEYREFAQEMKAASYTPDTMVWMEVNVETEDIHPFITYYYRNKAYNDYPVVGITHWQAEQYCKWKAEKINAAMVKNGFANYHAEVMLPSDGEWNSAYNKYILNWLRSPYNKCGFNPQNTYISYAFGCNKFRANFHGITTQRSEELKPVLDKNWQAYGFILTPVRSYQSAFGLYNLLGNVEEWTRTDAAGNLYNNLQFIYTTTGKIIPNIQTRIDSNALAGYLHETETMKDHFAVKGGSWMDDIYYLQPEALKFKPSMYRSKTLGFRYVVKLKKKF